MRKHLCKSYNPEVAICSCGKVFRGKRGKGLRMLNKHMVKGNKTI